jgi:ubiquinol-cytochrome c reductase cytochrome b/c1 subunit
MRLSGKNPMTNLVKAAVLALVTFAAAPVFAAEGGAVPAKESWTFAGPFGHFDRAQLQRGFKVYREVCSACHGMKLVSFRNLMEEGGPGFSEGQIRMLASEYQIQDGPGEDGQMFERAGRPSDRWPSPFPNDQAARASNGGALPPDFSVLAKSRTYTRGFWLSLLDLVLQYQEHGVDYIHALLTGYDHPVPEGHAGQEGLHYNPYFPGGWIAMAKPLADGQVEYTDGTPATVDQYARDVAAFMMWAAEPHLEARKQTGFIVMIFLIVFAGLLYFTKKKVWGNVAH